MRKASVQVHWALPDRGYDLIYFSGMKELVEKLSVYQYMEGKDLEKYFLD